MRFDVVTLFPQLFDSFLRESLIGKALDKEVFEVRLIDIRDFTTDRHRTADDRPYGGGAGMILMPEPLAKAISFARETDTDGVESRVVLLNPVGQPFSQQRAIKYATLEHLILVCGRYEGIDHRISLTLIDEEISLGDFVLSGGEVPAMAVIEAVTRLLPGVLGAAESVEEETFSNGLLEYPQYTRPRDFQGLAVPEVLLSGNHEAIRKWRRRESLKRTFQRRPDMLAKAELSDSDREFLGQLSKESSR
ncbi:MAG: tRNA (guanosine(37)-N1)-methyltransferase TrmD [Deltaproteobacteria bacterium]|nr:tRNA (guanosine(37)-N1)-methyltransferase TrmD [Deltaproteobacteria bacterium]MBW2052712.1 tRNA (guanosine(37)-N1)-methyltransferase TrmD [Deltaproteobacteria bacterium]MBW2141206.1 tRNA (guanosine(37)-N1)-methyltransferase TrmD [Deltaproteobacteria bacterium]